MWKVSSFGGMSEEVCEPLSQSLGGLNCRAKLRRSRGPSNQGETYAGIQHLSQSHHCA